MIKTDDLEFEEKDRKSTGKESEPPGKASKFKILLAFTIAGIITIVFFNWINFILWRLESFPNLSFLTPPKILQKIAETTQLGGQYYLEPEQQIKLDFEITGITIVRLESDGSVRLSVEKEVTKAVRRRIAGLKWESIGIMTTEKPSLDYYISAINTYSNQDKLKLRFNKLTNLDSTKMVSVQLKFLSLNSIEKEVVQIPRASVNSDNWIKTGLNVQESDFIFITPEHNAFELSVKTPLSDRKMFKYSPISWYHYPGMIREFWKISHLTLPPGDLYIRRLKGVGRDIEIRLFRGIFTRGERS